MIIAFIAKLRTKQSLVTTKTYLKELMVNIVPRHKQQDSE